MEKKVKFSEIIGREIEFLGKDIEIVNLSEDWEVYFNVKMRCKIINFIKHDWNTSNRYLEVVLDFNPFESYNKTKMIADFPDATGNPTLKWIDKPSYSGVDSLYIVKNTEISDNDTFKLVSDETNKLVEAFKNSDEKDYVAFLEKLALNSL